MSKRKVPEGVPFGVGGSKSGKVVRFDDNVTESEEGFLGPGPLPGERNGPDGVEGEIAEKKKHTLDSDEEEDDDDDDDSKAKYDVMNEDDVEGQEDKTVDFDDGERITPFNMKEEMEEGHFDKQGNYFLKKDNDIKDAWLDNVDWMKIKQKEKVEDENEADNDDDDDDDEDDDDVEDYSPSVIGWNEKHPIYEEMISLMEPGENIFKAIKRLGGGSSVGRSSASNRWKNKPKKDAVPEGQAKDSDHKDEMLRLTSLADKLLQSGDLGIYECTLEKLRHEIERNKSEKPVLKSMDVENDDDALDMFADEIDAEKLGAKTSTTTSDQPLKDDETQEAATEGVPQDFSHEIHWFYRWEKAHDADEHGPYPSTQMKTWNDLGYFPEGVWVRKAKQEIQEDLGNLYDSKRIDFELYT